MKMLGQAWVYRIGNTLVRVENAFAWSGWCQERLRVNDETAHEAYGWFGTRRDFDEDWLTSTGEGVLAVRLKARLMGISCEAFLDRERLEPEAHETVEWAGPRRSWPPADAWATAGARAWIVSPPNSRR